MKNIALYFTVLIIGLTTSLQAQNTNVPYQVWNTVSRTYDTEIRYYNAGNIASDYGPRILDGRHDWHGGVDFSAADVDEDLNYRILALYAGRVVRFVTTSSYYLMIDAQDVDPATQQVVNRDLDLAYVHIFRNGDQASNMLRGEFIIRPIDGFPNQYAILNTRTEVAIGVCPTNNCSGLTVTYGGQQYSVSNNVIQGQAIAPVGDSYGGQGNLSAHLHLQAVANTTGGIADGNDMNPLAYVTYPAPTYDFNIFTKMPNATAIEGLSVNYPSSVNSSSADTKTPIKLRVSLVQGQSAGQNATSNRIMDIERVELNMVPVNGRTRTTPVAHYYNYIVGTNLASTIQYGGIRRTQPNRYPTQIQVATGSWTSQGIYDNAYNSEDDFYFTDFAPRMNKNNHAQLAKLPDDAQYNDGAYALYPAVYNVSDTRVQPNDANVVFYIDNFKPYIKNVKVRRNDATSTLLCESNWSASSDRACIQLDNYRSPYTISSNQEYDLMMASSYPVKIVVTTSEPLKDLKMSIPLIGLPTTVSSNSNDLETEFTFTISSSQLRQMIQLQNPSNFNFIGKDYEDNSLLALQPQQLTCVNIPKRLSSGWADDMAQGTDVSHAAYIKLGSGCTRGFRSENPSNTTSLRQSLPGACIYVDFKYTIGNNGEVKFTDMSSGQTTISNWQWIFGDGGSISQQHPTHRYNTLGATTEELCFDVKLTATDISGNTGSETKHICIPVLSNGSMYVKILNPVPVYESSCIKEWVKATTGQQMRFEGSVLGGTPPYTFDWRIAGAQATPSVISGPGPHYVTFTTATSGGLDLCSREGAIQLTVKDANNVIKTTSVRLNVRSSAIDGPGNLKIVCSKDAPCENEEVSLTVKSQDPFGFVFPETYKWFIDNVEQPEIFKKIKRKFTPGTHDVRVEVTDGGGSIYRVGPLTLAVKTTLECNSPGTVSPRFQILVNNQVGGGNPLTLEAANPCSADGSIDPTTGGKTSKIHIRVPNLGTSTARDNSLLRQVPDYFFVFSVEYNGVTKPLTIGGGYGSLSNVLTEKWLITNNYRPRVNGSFLEYPIPLCFANCAPLFGNSRLVVSVGRFAEEKIQQRCVPEAVLPPTDITSRCMGVAGVDYFVSLCANFIETMTNENLQVQVCRSPTITGAVCQQLTRPETILQREVIKDMKTGYYDIFVKHDAPPLSISNIQSTITCASVSLSTTVSGGVNQVPNLDANNPSFCAASTPYSVRWQIFDYNNPLVEITGNIFLTANNIPNPSINLQHPYFNTFGANDNKLFIAQITAIDLLGNRAIGTQIVKISPPIKINLPDVINRCPSNNTTLTNGATVVGGTPPYRFIWSSTSNVFMEPPTSTTSNPLLKLIGLPSPTVVIDLTVSDANGCSVRKNIVLNVNNLKSFSMNTSSLTACADESSKLIIGPLNCTPTTLKECLGGSGEYNFRWACNDPEGLGKLSDPTSAFPRVIGIIDRTVNYRLFVSDANGGCGEKMSTNEVMVRGEQVFFTVNLGADKILCAGDKSVTLKADTRSGGASFSTGFTYEWQSDKPNFSTSVSTNLLPINNLLAGTKNTYKVTSIHTRTQCSAIDDIQVEVRKDWTYKGYESKIMPIRENNTGLLWQVNDSEIFVNGNKGSGAVPNFTYTTTPALRLYTPQFAPYRALQQSLWSPSLPAYTPSAIVTMTDGAGCKKDFPTNTFYILKKDPVVTVSSDKKVVCNGGDICLYLSVKLDVVEETKKYLPTSFSVNYDFRKADLDRSAVWVYSTPSYLTDINGKVEFTLTDPTTGTYTAIKCFKIPNISPTTHYAFLVDNGGLPNATQGNGTFNIAYQFAASSSGAIQDEDRVEGTFSSYSYDGWPRRRAAKTLYLGSSFYYGNVRQGYLITRNNAYAEFSAGKIGQVLMQYDIDIQNTTQYFHAFIDPCLVSSGKLREEDTEIIQSLKSNKVQDLSGVFNAFPNPFTNDITLNYEVRNEKGSQVSITLYNGLGQLIDKPLDTVFNEQRVFSINYNGSKLTPGIYLFELNIDGNKFLKKVIKKN